MYDDCSGGVYGKVRCGTECLTSGQGSNVTALDQRSCNRVRSGISSTDERKKAMDSSDPCIGSSQAVLMRVENEGLSLNDFKAKGKKLSAQANTTDAQVAESIVGKDNVVAYDSFAANSWVSSGILLSPRVRMKVPCSRPKRTAWVPGPTVRPRRGPAPAAA